MAEDFTTEIDQEIQKNYLRNKAVLDQYESSPAQEEQIQSDHLDQQYGTLAETEIKNVADDTEGFVDHVGSFAKNLGIGAAKGVEETLQTLRLADDNAFNLPEPEGIANSLAQGIGQFLPMFVGGGWAIRGGLKLANLFQKSGKLTRAGRNLTAVGAGALSDVVAFDPKDPNMGNLALALGAVSEDSRTGAAVKKFLAQRDEDSEVVARSKNALTGMIAGAITEGLIRGTGYALKKTGVINPKAPVKATDEIPLNEADELDIDEAIPENTKDVDISEPEIKGGALDIAKDLTDVLDTIRKQEGSAEKLKSSMRDVPDEQQAIVDTLEKEETRISNVWEKLKAEDSRITDGIKDAFIRMGKGEKLPNQPFTIQEGPWKGKPLIESMNFLKLNTTQEARNTLQFLAKEFDIKDLAKPRIDTDDFKVVVADLLDIDPTDDVAMREAIDMVGNAAAGVDEAIKYIGSAKILSQVSYDAMIAASKRDVAEGTAASARDFAEKARTQELIQRAGGLLAKKTSDALRAHKQPVAAKNNEDLLKAELLGQLVKSPKKLQKKISSMPEVLDSQDKFTQKVLFEDLKKAKKTTVTRGETPTGRKAVKQIKRLTDAQRLVNKVKSLKKTLRSEKAPERGAPFPKAKPLKDTPEIKDLKAQIKKVRQERDTLENKFKREAKEQLKIRKQAKSLSEDIENLRKGLKPQRKGKELKPTEINELKAEKTKELNKLKAQISGQEKAQGRIDKLNKEFSNLLLKRINKLDDTTPVAKTEITQIEKDLKEAIANENKKIQERVTRQELEETLISKSTREVQDEINRMSLRQLQTRVQSINKSFGAKTMDTFLEIYINGLLSSVKTFGSVNPIGNTSAFVSTVIERAFAGATGNQIAMRESTELAWTALTSLPDMFKTFVSAMRHGPSDANIKADLVRPFERQLSKEAFNLGGTLGKLVDFMGTVVNIPGKILLSQDEAFKAMIVRGETRALAFRKARNKFSTENLSDPLVKAKIQREFDDILADLNKHPEIGEGAKETAAKTSFTNDLPDKEVIDGRTGKPRVVPGVSKWVQQGIDRHGLLRVFIPFFRTPVNILNFTWERTPLLQFANRTLKNELTSDNPAVKQLAYAKVGTSFGITGAMFGMAMTGNFTGAPPRDYNLRRTMEQKMGGNHWFSFYWDGTIAGVKTADAGWRKYDRFDPFGVMMASSAAMATMAKSMISLNGKFEEEGDPTGLIREKYDEVVNATVLGTLELIKDRHYIQGISELVSFLSGDPRGLTPTFKRIASAADPRISFYSSLRRGVTRGLEPEKQRKLQRGSNEQPDVPEATGLKAIVEEMVLSHEEALRDTTPGYGQILPEKNLVGDVVSFPGTNGEFDSFHNIINAAVSPIPGLVPSKSPLINKLAELESKIAQPSSIRKVGNVVMNEEEKSFVIDQWTSLNKKVAEPMVTNKFFKKQSTGLQKLMLENLINQNKQIAMKLAIGKFNRLSQGYVDHKIQDAQRKVGNQPQGFQSLLNLGQGQ
jgi:hypothetical protein